jgi:hypothetical protein
MGEDSQMNRELVMRKILSWKTIIKITTRRTRRGLHLQRSAKMLQLK